MTTYVIIQPSTVNTLSFLEIKGSISPCFQSASLLWVFHLVKRHYITLKHDSPHNIHTVCRRSSTLLQVNSHNTQYSCHLGTDYCLWISQVVCKQQHLEQDRAVWDGKKVTFICSIKTFSGLAEQGCWTASPFPCVEQDSTGCLPKDQLNTNLEDPDPSLPNHTSSITAHRSCQSYFQNKVRCIPSAQKLWWQKPISPSIALTAIPGNTHTAPPWGRHPADPLIFSYLYFSNLVISLPVDNA